MRAFTLITLSLGCLTIWTALGNAAVRQVGPGKTYATPCKAIAAAASGDTIQIDAAGNYAGDVCGWTTSNLTLQGVNGRPRIDAAGRNAQGKATWVISGSNTTVDNIEFSGATVPSHNGAAIRQEGANLTLKNCYIHDNEDGILTTDNSSSQILISNTEFYNNGFGDGQSHNMYINHVAKFTLQYSYSHHAKVGHEVKSRALTNYILYNRITDEQGGTASYGIDLPNGGAAYIIGNIMQKAPTAGNSTMIAFAAEGASNPSQELYVVNNTLVNDFGGGTFVRVFSSPSVSKLINNIFRGAGAVLSGPGTQTSNLSGTNPLFVNQAGYDYHLQAGSPAIDKGTNPGSSSNGTSLSPTAQYVYPTGSAARSASGAIDIGAYEYAGSTPPPPAAPVISSFSASPSTITAGGSSTLSWSVSGASTLSIDNGVGAVTGTSTTVKPAQNTTYRLTATNSAGSVTAAATVTVNPAPVADTQAPSVPAGLSAAAVSSSQINLSWSASSDNVGTAGYRVFRNGAQVGTAAGTSFQSTGLAASTSYSYAVAAFDAAGNASGQSSAASATTQAAVVTLSSLACSPTTLASGASATCTVTLSQAAPSGGALVALSDNSAALTIPSSVTVSSTSATFTANAGTVTTNQSATVTATFGGVSKTATISLTTATTSSTLQVGPTRTYKTPCAAAAAAKTGNTIEIDAGTYRNEACVWSTSGLTIRGVGGRPVLDDTGYTISNGKAIWVISGSNTTIDNIEFMGASVPSQNGAAIRQEGANLTLKNSYIHDNEDGILTTDNSSSTILISNTEFNNNGFGDGQSHNIYVNHVAKFTLQYSFSHHAKVGHLVKSRAYQNYILYNRLSDESTGTASYELDLPNGGTSYVIGNVIQQGLQSGNSTLIAYAEEGASNPSNDLYVVNNTLVNDKSSGTFIGIASGAAAAVIRNNIFAGPGTATTQSSATFTNNAINGNLMFVNAANYDYHLQSGSSAIGIGANPGSGNGFSLMPVFQYVSPTCYENRATSGAAIDAGAFEFGGAGGSAVCSLP